MKTLGKAAIAIALVVGAPLIYTQYKRYPVDSFCKSLSPQDTRKQVLTTAQVTGLWVNPLDKEGASVHVFNQWAPWFRFACVVEFNNDRVVGASVIAAD